jgi:hypothetical protein
MTSLNKRTNCLTDDMESESISALICTISPRLLDEMGALHSLVPVVFVVYVNFQHFSANSYKGNRLTAYVSLIMFA